MNWEATGAIADILSAVAVLATLVYLALQIRQNSYAIDQQNGIANAQILQQRADSVVQLAALVLNSEANLAIFTKLLTNKELNPDHLDVNERARVEFLLPPLRANLENLFLQYQSGFIRDDFYQDVAGPLFLKFGPLFLKFNLALTGEFRAELIRIIATEEKSRPEA